MVILWICRDQNYLTPWYKSDRPRVVPPFRYGQGILMGIPHHIILSNIIGRWGAMFHVKHERLFAISWGLFHFHTSQKLGYLPISHTNSPPTNRITKPFTRGGEYLHPSLKTPHIITYHHPLTVSFPIYIQILIYLLITTNYH